MVNKMFGMQSSIFGSFLNSKQSAKPQSVMANLDQKYWLTAKKQLIQQLAILKNRQYLLTGQDPQKTYSFQTLILKIENNMLFLDLPTKDAVLKKILERGCIDFYCNFQGVKVWFSGNHPKLIKVKSEQCLAVSLPDCLYWKEDRSLHRVRIPVSHQKTYLAIDFKNSASTNTDIRFQVHDLSSHGFAFINHDRAMSEYFKADTELTGHLFTANFSTISIKFAVKHMTLKSSNGQFAELIGCHFNKIDFNDESRIQNYIQNIETRHLLLN